SENRPTTDMRGRRFAPCHWAPIYSRTFRGCMNEQNQRKKPEPGDPATSERHAGRCAYETLQALGNLPRDLDDWLHAELKPLGGQACPVVPTNRREFSRKLIEW